MNISLAQKILEELQTASLNKMQKVPQFLLPFNYFYTPVPLAEEYFTALTPIHSSFPFVFVDGGNAELLRTPDFSLQFLRFAAVCFHNEKRTFVKVQEGYLLVKTQCIDENIYFVTKGFEGLDYAEPILIAASDPLLRDAPERTKPAIVAALCRSLLEIQFAATLVPQEGVLVLDRPLLPENSYEHASFTFLQERMKNTKSILCGLAKTTTLLCNTGESIVAALDRFQKKGSWIYFPIFSSYDEKHSALVSFVKLHPASSYIFRFEGKTIDFEKLKTTASGLASFSSDVLFPGYPYGLIIADQHARISKKEEEYRKTLFFSYVSPQNFSLHALNAHDILDQ